jgi:hypothetical protein
MCGGSTIICVYRLDFQYNSFYMSILLQKIAFVCEFQHTPMQKMIFFSIFHTSCGYEILGTCT